MGPCRGLGHGWHVLGRVDPGFGTGERLSKGNLKFKKLTVKMQILHLCDDNLLVLNALVLAKGQGPLDPP